MANHTSNDFTVADLHKFMADVKQYAIHPTTVHGWDANGSPVAEDFIEIPIHPDSIMGALVIIDDILKNEIGSLRRDVASETQRKRAVEWLEELQERQVGLPMKRLPQTGLRRHQGSWTLMQTGRSK